MFECLTVWWRELTSIYFEREHNNLLIFLSLIYLYNINIKIGGVGENYRHILFFFILLDFYRQQHGPTLPPKPNQYLFRFLHQPTLLSPNPFPLFPVTPLYFVCFLFPTHKLYFKVELIDFQIRINGFDFIYEEGPEFRYVSW